MRKTDRLIKVAALFLFLAMLAYVGYYAWQQLANPMVTAMAVTTTVRDSTTAAGLVAREETLLPSSAAYIQVAVDESSHVASGTPLAVELTSEAALNRQSQLLDMEVEIERIRTLLEEQENRESLAGSDGAIRRATLALTGAVARHEVAELETLGSKFSSLVLDAGGTPVTQELLDALVAQYDAQRNSAELGANWIYAPASGLFSTVVDGWEDISRASLEGLGPSALRQLLQTDRDPASGVVGKLVTSYTWYYAAILRTEYAALLELEQQVELEFGRHYSNSITGRVISISPAENGEQVVVFAINEAMADTMAMRTVNVELVLEEHSGIRVPQDAVRRDGEDGEPYVYAITAGRAEKKSVEIVYTYQEYCLVAPSTAASALREGSEIIVSARDLYDGKILG